MGVCPQHNILFDSLTVQEHLEVFYEFKGGNVKLRKEDIDQLITGLGLNDFRHVRADNLSGGNKRKLSIAIALCGGSKFLLLDEPSAGLDINARRQMWNMLARYKQGRVVCLTTHYMDEADILGDRIGIMNKGSLTVLGSSLFLKNRFGEGYEMTIIKKPEQTFPTILDFFRQHLGSSIIVMSQNNDEMKISFPKSLTPSLVSFVALLDDSLA